MAIATVVGTPYKDATSAYMTVLIAEGGNTGNVEYNAVAPLIDPVTGQSRTAPQIKAALIVDVQRQRAAQIPVAPVAIGISGTVTV